MISECLLSSILLADGLSERDNRCLLTLSIRWRIAYFTVFS